MMLKLFLLAIFTCSQLAIAANMDNNEAGASCEPEFDIRIQDAPPSSSEQAEPSCSTGLAGGIENTSLDNITDAQEQIEAVDCSQGAFGGNQSLSNAEKEKLKKEFKKFKKQCKKMARKARRKAMLEALKRGKINFALRLLLGAGKVEANQRIQNIAREMESIPLPNNPTAAELAEYQKRFLEKLKAKAPEAFLELSGRNPQDQLVNTFKNKCHVPVAITMGGRYRCDLSNYFDVEVEEPENDIQIGPFDNLESFPDDCAIIARDKNDFMNKCALMGFPDEAQCKANLCARGIRGNGPRPDVDFSQYSNATSNFENQINSILSQMQANPNLVPDFHIMAGRNLWPDATPQLAARRAEFYQRVFFERAGKLNPKPAWMNGLNYEQFKQKFVREDLLGVNNDGNYGPDPKSRRSDDQVGSYLASLTDREEELTAEINPFKEAIRNLQTELQTHTANFNQLNALVTTAQTNGSLGGGFSNFEDLRKEWINAQQNIFSTKLSIERAKLRIQELERQLAVVAINPNTGRRPMQEHLMAYYEHQIPSVLGEYSPSSLRNWLTQESNANLPAPYDSFSVKALLEGRVANFPTDLIPAIKNFMQTGTPPANIEQIQRALFLNFKNGWDNLIWKNFKVFKVEGSLRSEAQSPITSNDEILPELSLVLEGQGQFEEFECNYNFNNIRDVGNDALRGTAGVLKGIGGIVAYPFALVAEGTAQLGQAASTGHCSRQRLVLLDKYNKAMFSAVGRPRDLNLVNPRRLNERQKKRLKETQDYFKANCAELINQFQSRSSR